MANIDYSSSDDEEETNYKPPTNYNQQTYSQSKPNIDHAQKENLKNTQNAQQPDNKHVNNRYPMNQTTKGPTKQNNNNNVINQSLYEYSDEEDEDDSPQQPQQQKQQKQQPQGNEFQIQSEQKKYEYSDEEDDDDHYNQPKNNQQQQPQQNNRYPMPTKRDGDDQYNEHTNNQQQQPQHPRYPMETKRNDDDKMNKGKDIQKRDKVDDELVVRKVFHSRFKDNPRNPWDPQNWQKNKRAFSLINKRNGNNGGGQFCIIDKTGPKNGGNNHYNRRGGGNGGNGRGRGGGHRPYKCVLCGGDHPKGQCQQFRRPPLPYNNRRNDDQYQNDPNNY